MQNSNKQNSTLAMLSYLRDEAERAESVEEIMEILQLLEKAIHERPMASPVQGLKHINVEYLRADNDPSFNVATNVPESLVSTFYDLSDKMNQLQTEDPETFSNASTALHWLANNDKIVS